MRLSEIMQALDLRGERFLLVHAPNDGGAFIATPGCARIIAFAPNVEAENLFWSDRAALASGVGPLQGPCGGERLWFGPESRFHWNGAPDWVGFTNNVPSLGADPGAYGLSPCGPAGICFEGPVLIRDHPTGQMVSARVRKVVTLLPAKRGYGFGLRLKIGLQVNPIDEGIPIDLWAICQFAPGSRVQVPLDSATEPTVYTPSRGAWTLSDGAVEWTLAGGEPAKIGLSARHISGTVTVALPEGRGSLRLEFSPRVAADYCDHPFGLPRNDQVLQIWDGFGFGEVELHSPAASTLANHNGTSVSYEIWYLPAEQCVGQTAV